MSNYSADDFTVHFSSKIEKIRTATASGPAIVIRSTAATPLSSLRPVDAAEIMCLLSRTPSKHCQFDSVLTCWKYFTIDSRSLTFHFRGFVRIRLTGLSQAVHMVFNLNEVRFVAVSHRDLFLDQLNLSLTLKMWSCVC